MWKMRFQKRRFRCRGPPKIELRGDEKRAKTHKKTGFFTKTRFPKTAIPHERSLKNPLLTIKTRWKFEQNFDQKWGQKRLQKYPQDAFKNDIQTSSKTDFQRELRKESKKWGPLTRNGHFLKTCLSKWTGSAVKCRTTDRPVSHRCLCEWKAKPH